MNTRSLLRPDELCTQFVTLNWNDYLVVTSSNVVTVLEMPCSVTLWLVALKLPLEICSVRVSPSALKELILVPFTDIFHSSCAEYICASTMFFSIEPVTWKHVLVGVNVHSFALLITCDPLTIVLTLISIHQTSNSILFICLELTSINITVGEGILSLTVSLAINILSLVDLSIGVCCSGFSIVIFWGVGCFASFRKELIWLLLFLFLFWHLKLNLIW